MHRSRVSIASRQESESRPMIRERAPVARSVGFADSGPRRSPARGPLRDPSPRRRAPGRCERRARSLSRDQSHATSEHRSAPCILFEMRGARSSDRPLGRMLSTIIARRIRAGSPTSLLAARPAERISTSARSLDERRLSGRGRSRRYAARYRMNPLAMRSSSSELGRDAASAAISTTAPRVELARREASSSSLRHSRGGQCGRIAFGDVEATSFLSEHGEAFDEARARTTRRATTD